MVNGDVDRADVAVGSSTEGRGLEWLLPAQNVIAFQPEVLAKPRKVKAKRA